MGLWMISEAADTMDRTGHGFSAWEKEFVVQFAFKTGDKELTDKLIDELCACPGGEESGRIMEKYATMYDAKPDWPEAIENLIVALEQYRLEEEKAVSRLAELLSAYGVDMPKEEVREADLSELKKRIRKEASL